MIASFLRSSVGMRELLISGFQPYGLTQTSRAAIIHNITLFVHNANHPEEIYD
jgi:hypothetical protein